MKILYSAVLLFTVLKQTISQTCGQNVFYNDFIDYTQYLKNYDVTIYDKINDYQNLTPSSYGNSFCTQTSASSCCKTDFELALKDLAYQYYRVQSDKDYFLQQFFDAFKQGLKDCSQNQSIKDYEDEELELLQVKTLLDSYRLSILKIIRADVKLLRGNLCILCASNINYADFINGQKIIVETEDLNSYIKEIATNLQAIQNQKSAMKLAALEYYNKVSNTANCGTQLEQANTFIDNLKLCPGGDCEAHVSARVQIFLQNTLHELGNIVIPDFSSSRRILESNIKDNDNIQQDNLQIDQQQNIQINQKRQLSLANNYEQQTGKFKTYRSDEIDNEMQYQGISDITEENIQYIIKLSLSLIAFLSVILI